LAVRVIEDFSEVVGDAMKDPFAGMGANTFPVTGSF
jgi:hypothetical protein